MKPGAWIVVVALIVVAAVAGYFVGRRRTPEVQAFDRVIVQTVYKPTVVHDSSSTPGTPPKADEEARGFEERTRADIIEGRTAALDLVKKFLAETDDANLMAYASILKSVPEGFSDIRVVDAMLGALQGSMEHRNAALFFLAGAVDGDGRVAKALLDHTTKQTPLNLRALAFAGLREFVERNERHRDLVNARLLEVAATDGDAQARSMAVYALSSPDASRLAALRPNEKSSQVRAQIYERLGELQDGAAPLEDAFAVEVDANARKAALFSLVKVGGVSALQRVQPLAGDLAADVDDYLAILGAGVTSPEMIVQAKIQREALRAPK